MTTPTSMNSFPAGCKGSMRQERLYQEFYFRCGKPYREYTLGSVFLGYDAIVEGDKAKLRDGQHYDAKFRQGEIEEVVKEIVRKNCAAKAAAKLEAEGLTEKETAVLLLKKRKRSTEDEATEGPILKRARME